MDVIECFEQLVSEEDFPDEAEPIVDYFEKYYVGRPSRRRGQPRKEAMFPIPLWNVHDQTCAGDPRINNSVEGWHRRFSHHLLCSHPSIWMFIGLLQTEEAATAKKLARVDAGEAEPPRKKRYVTVDKRLVRLAQSYEERDPMAYLRGIARNLHTLVAR